MANIYTSVLFVMLTFGTVRHCHSSFVEYSTYKNVSISGGVCRKHTARKTGECSCLCNDDKKCDTFTFDETANECGICQAPGVIETRNVGGVTLGRKVYRDCADVGEITFDGIHYVKPDKSVKEFLVKCESGWTVIFDRFNGSLNFDRNWTEYKDGFGDLNSEFWIGNEYMHILTNQAKYQLQMEITLFNDTVIVDSHDNFVIGSENDLYSMDTSDDGALSLTNAPFSTYDFDHDTDVSNCAYDRQGGWWYQRCALVSLTGFYAAGGNTCDNPRRSGFLPYYCMKIFLDKHVLVKAAKFKIRKI